MSEMLQADKVKIVACDGRALPGNIIIYFIQIYNKLSFKNLGPGNALSPAGGQP